MGVLDLYKGIIQQASQITEKDRTYFSLGTLSINRTLGDLRGIPSGRIVQITGRESTGKSTLVYDIIGQYIREHQKPVVLLDIERSFIASYAYACGVDLSYLYVVHPETTEQGFDIIEKVMKAEESRLFVIDSVAAMVGKDESGKNYGDNEKMASSAGLITRMVKRINPLLYDHDCLLILINQLRMNFSTLSPEKYIPFGGLALSYATSVRIDLTRVKSEDSRQLVNASIKKSKVSSPRNLASFVIEYGKGIDHNSDIFALALEYGLIKRSGSWFQFQDQKYQGQKTFMESVNMFDLRNLVIKEIENEYVTESMVESS